MATALTGIKRPVLRWMKRAVEDENWDISAVHVMVLQNAGPMGGPGMPEWGMLPMPRKLLKEGHRDMLRISDARMSGTSYGVCVLHVAPESWIGGHLALLRTGDIVSIDVAARTIHTEVSYEALAHCKAQWTPPKPRFERAMGSSSFRRKWPTKSRTRRPR